MGQKILGGLRPLLGEGVGPHLRSNTQSALGWGRPPYQVASWRIQPFVNNRMGRKFGRGYGPFGEGAGSPSNRKSPRLRPTSSPIGLPIKWHLDPCSNLLIGHNRYWPKLGAVPLWGRAEAYLHILIHPTVWPHTPKPTSQFHSQTGQDWQDNGPIAWGNYFTKGRPKTIHKPTLKLMTH